MRSTILSVVSLLGMMPLMLQAQTPADLPKTKAELSNYEETSRYDDVMAFFAAMQKRSDLLRVEIFGHTQEGRAMPLMIFADPPISQPREAMESGRPIVFIMANIHAGEVEGKEAVQVLARRLLLGDLRPLLDKVVILIDPIYNADGNEKIDLMNRTAQNGPIAGVGVRENSKGLDLNRDYMKLDAPETQALVRLFNRWDPLITVDLHTTDGSYHGYHLTYSIPLNPATDPQLAAYHRDKMMPALADAMLAQHKFRTYYYGNFGRGAGGGAGAGGAGARGPQSRPAGAAAAAQSWQAFSPQPRVGQNYIGLRNRLTILSEAYSYLDFKGRIDVTEAFVEEIFKYAAGHGDELRQLVRSVDQNTIARGLSGPPLQLGVEFAPKALPNPVELLVGEVTRIRNPRNGRDMTAMVPDKVTPVKMLDYGMFAATRTVPTARAYLFKDEPGMRPAIDKLLNHGITVETLTAPATVDVQSFTIGAVNKAARPFQGHSETKLTGEYKNVKLEFPAGSILVRSAQPLGTLASYLLEPESDDGLATWNFLDSYLKAGATYPVFKVMQDVQLTSRLIEQR